MGASVGYYLEGFPAYVLAYLLIGLPLCIFTVIFAKKHLIDETKGVIPILFFISFIVLFEGLFWPASKFIPFDLFL